MERDHPLIELIKWLLKPRRTPVPPIAWLLLLVGILYLMIGQGETLPRELITERIVVATPTPGPHITPTPRPTPVGSGGTLAFTMRHNGNSDIYLISQNTGNLLRLTYDPAEDRDPAWSPDGRKLAFASHRAQNWDLYVMDMTSGTVLRLTRSPYFEANPTWSPDGRWLAYEAYDEDNLDIYVLNVESGESQRLTTNPAPEYAPAWAPDGRHIAFTAYKNHNRDLYLISLDDGAISNLTNTPNQDENFAAWSPQGDYLAYSAGVPGDETIWMIPFEKEAMTSGELRPVLFGVGGQPVWSPDGEALAFIFRQRETSYLIAANTTGWALAQEGYSTTDWMNTPDWTATALDPKFEAQLQRQMTEERSPLYTEILRSSATERYQLIPLPDVNGSNTAQQLSDRVNDSFNAMRKTVLAQTGWDYLSVLGDSSRAMNHTPRPGQGRISWHVCGRAIDINQGFLRQGLIELVREDIGGVTYWRVFIKAQEQDGSLGEPLRSAPWDLNARSAGGEASVHGGKLKPIPQGYYVDFTTIAADYGWERRNALSNWRSSYFDIEWWHFQKTEGMSWYNCMLEIYTAEEVKESYGDLPWWTERPEWEVQAMP